GMWTLRAKRHVVSSITTLLVARSDTVEQEAQMNGHFVLADLFRSSNPTGLLEPKRPLLLLPRTAADELPVYPEQLSMVEGRPRRKLDPAWSVFPAQDRQS